MCPASTLVAYNNTFIGNIKSDFAWVFKTDTWGDRIINNIATGNIALKDETLARTNFGNIADPGFENADEHQYSLLANSGHRRCGSYSWHQLTTYGNCT